MVLSARHIHLDRDVAIKFLKPKWARHAAIVARFLREARAASAIQSEHVARVLDVAMLPSGEPYIVMERLEGRDLSAVIAARGPLPIAEAIDYVLQACEAIAEAHSLGVIHRDLKPSNLFLSARADGSPLVKVLDFGLSKAVRCGFLAGGLAVAELTAAGEVIGSPLYMSPEQVRGSKSIDVRSDVWALGAILHKMLTGRPPFQGDSTMTTLAMVTASAPTPLRMLCPDAPEALEALILRCLQKDVTARIRDVAELAEALLPFAKAESRLSVERTVKVVRSPSMARRSVQMPLGEPSSARRPSASASTIPALAVRVAQPRSASPRRWMMAGGALAAFLSVLFCVAALPRDAARSAASVLSDDAVRFTAHALSIHARELSRFQSSQPPAPEAVDPGTPVLSTMRVGALSVPPTAPLHPVHRAPPRVAAWRAPAKPSRAPVKPSRAPAARSHLRRPAPSD